MNGIKASYIDHMGSDLSVANAARVSFRKKHNSFQPSDLHLIEYLAKHKHFSPFGHCFASFHVKAPIFVARQLVKHEYLRWNEVSRRYVDDLPEMYLPDYWRGRPINKKQGSEGVADYKTNHNLYSHLNHAQTIYIEMLEAGVAPEQARTILPQNMFTEWYWSGSLDAFANMCKLRLAEDTQYESQLVAQQISKKMIELFPISWEALINN